jgi:hypothetical protein
MKRKFEALMCSFLKEWNFLFLKSNGRYGGLSNGRNNSLNIIQYSFQNAII